MAYLADQTSNTRYCPVFDWVGEPHYFRDMPHETPPGTRLAVEGFPRSLKIKSAHKALPDFFLLSGKYAVSSNTKDILDEFEPGKHQFIPVDLFRKNGEPFEGDFFVLHVRSAVDAIVPEESDVYTDTTDNGYRFLQIAKVRPNLTVRRNATIHRHFWTGDKNFSNLFFCSDEFFKRVKSAKLKGFDFTPMREA
ncbi:DUF1629 domain-containing protein [Roseibium sp. HPY-6]|uniref:imm11 family protein n=1 Tax=Roseibium sp. HPY-6 TaxID=3229852 RepID=UPI00338DC456